MRNPTWEDLPLEPKVSEPAARLFCFLASSVVASISKRVFFCSTATFYCSTAGILSSWSVRASSFASRFVRVSPPCAPVFSHRISADFPLMRWSLKSRQWQLCCNLGVSICSFTFPRGKNARKCSVTHLKRLPCDPLEAEKNAPLCPKW